MPTVHDHKSLSQRLGKVIKNLDKLKNEIGIFDAMHPHVRRLEQTVQHKVDSLENKKAIEKKKADEKKRLAEEEKVQQEEQARIDELIEKERAEAEAAAEAAAEEAEEADSEDK